ncbi:HlyD family secretion protein [Luteibacter sp. CQ10]|uniref:HlyD family secretion protein n=1 Tax=Luteibacter sp. CQ10 TaxID=2805821 RepID=UPI0034A5D188
MAFTAVILVSFHYTRREQAAGWLVPIGGLANVVAPAQASIVNILVADGSHVHAGDALLILSSERESLEHGGMYAEASLQLADKRASLIADARIQPDEAQRKKALFREKIALLEGQAEAIRQQLALEKGPSETARDLYAQWKISANKGFISKAQLAQQGDVVLQHESKERSLQQQGLALDQHIAEARSELAGIDMETERSIRDIKRRISDIDSSLSSNAAARQTVLRAPNDGLISTVLVHAGQSVSEHQLLLTLLPGKAILQAELWLPSRAIGFLEAGAQVRLRYEAYPYQKFGIQTGRVATIARSAVPAPDINRQNGQEFKEARYRVLVTLDRQTIVTYGHDEPLKPGMAIDADITLDRRRLIEWMFEPFLGWRSQWTNAERKVSAHG